MTIWKKDIVEGEIIGNPENPPMLVNSFEALDLVYNSILDPGFSIIPDFPFSYSEWIVDKIIEKLDKDTKLTVKEIDQLSNWRLDMFTFFVNKEFQSIFLEKLIQLGIFSMKDEEILGIVTKINN